MGIAITVGELARMRAENDSPQAIASLSADLSRINRILRAARLPDHNEPEALPELMGRSPLCGFPYSCLHDLRRALAYVRAGREPLPFREGENSSEDPLLKREYQNKRCDSHLIYHSDCEGYYVPVDFPSPMRGTWLRRPPQGPLGSSQCLLAELQQLAPHIGIALVNGDLSDAAAEALAAETDSEAQEPFVLEREVWFSIFEAARLSVEFKCLISFN